MHSKVNPHNYTSSMLPVHCCLQHLAQGLKQLSSSFVEMAASVEPGTEQRQYQY